MTDLKRRTIVELQIESIAFGGQAVAHHDGYTIFVDRGLPGQRVQAQIVRQKKNYAEARILNILSHSPFEVPAPCQHFGVCGGCQFQNLDYQEQLAQKYRQVVDSLTHIGGFTNLDVLPILPSPDVYYYRNKMEFSFARQRWLTQEEIQSQQPIDRDFALGLHVPRYYDKVLDIDNCLLLSEQGNQVLSTVKAFARASGLRAYSTEDHSGFWRFLVVRQSKRTGHMMVNLVTADHPDGSRLIEQLAEELRRSFPFIITVVHNISRKKAQIAFGDEEHIIYGPGYIEEWLGDKRYRISANSFFQTNSRQAERMYQLIADWGQFDNQQIVYDLYCGSGGIAIFIAPQVHRVVGVELVPQAIQDAVINCQLNSVDNCDFIQGDLKDQFADPEGIIKAYGRPTTVIIDPPRSGMHPKLPANILRLQPLTMIYVSCNPASLARDLKAMVNGEYQIRKVQPIDMFPHTAHCEVVVLLERRSA